VGDNVAYSACKLGLANQFVGVRLLCYSVHLADSRLYVCLEASLAPCYHISVPLPGHAFCAVDGKTQSILDVVVGIMRSYNAWGVS